MFVVKIDPAGKYLFYTDNETIHGIEYQVPVTPVPGMPLVFDMTSNFLTRPVNVSNYGAIIAGTQKNAGVAGLAIIIVRDDLIGKPQTICPSILDYKVLNANRSLYNTPATYSYVSIIISIIKINDNMILSIFFFSFQNIHV